MFLQMPICSTLPKLCSWNWERPCFVVECVLPHIMWIELNMGGVWTCVESHINCLLHRIGLYKLLPKVSVATLLIFFTNGIV